MELEQLKTEIMRIWKGSKFRYGASKIHKILSSARKQISLKRVQRYMKELDIHSIVVKKFRYHTSKTSSAERENILNRDFKTTGINPKWCTNIIYIHTLKDGWTYLAFVMDFHSRKIIGYAYGTSMTDELALKAVENACLNVSITKDIILQSDLGTQYTSNVFQNYLREKGIIHSFSRKK